MQSSVTVSLEEFCRYASEADVLIWNATITRAPDSLEALTAEEPVFASFRAVRDGAVWCTDESMYQRADAAGSIVSDLHDVLSEKADTQFFHPVSGEAEKAA